MLATQPSNDGLLLGRKQDAPAVVARQQEVVLIEPRALFRECLTRALSSLETDARILSFPSVKSWRATGSDLASVCLVILSVHPNKSADTDSDLGHLARLPSSVPVVLLSDADAPDQILDALEVGAKGYIPTSIGLDVALRAMNLVKAGGTFVPASSLLLSKRAIKDAASTRSYCNGMFTARQAAVIDSLRQGKANKTIAYELNMAESTVKVHVRNIMKKLKARNRTEVVCITNSFFNAAANS